MRKERLLRNTALLSASSLLMSLIGMVFQAWLAARIGAAGIGLVQLVGSVTALAATFAISGIRFASTRLVAEELGAGRSAGVPAAMRRCLGYAALFGTAAGLILWLCAAPVGDAWVGDGRTVLSLRLSAFSMPCISLCASLSGYFTGCGRLWRPTLIHLAEQLAGIVLVGLFLHKAPEGDVEASCAAVVCGRMLADFLSLLLMLAAYRGDRARHYPSEESGTKQTGRLLKIALPLASSAYARSGLSTARHLLIPRGLRASGSSADGALAAYGRIHGMALPVLLFPSCILAAAAELIVPELTRSQVRRENGSIRRAVRAFLGLSLLFACAAAAALCLLARPIGLRVFHSAEAGHFIRLLAPLVPVMYLDMSVDGCLKGLGQQVWSMGINIAESLVGLALVWLLLPRLGLRGYLFILCATEGLNLLLSMGRLFTVLRAIPEAEARSSPVWPAQTA